MLETGATFGQFKIIRKLGAGGMGEVYLAEDTKLGRQVALKTLTGELFDKTEQRERFVREARMAAQISHGNVMAIYDLGELPDESGNPLTFIVMEYINGESLTAYLSKDHADLGRTVALAEKIVSGLAAAHKLNIVHRDIKPDNIMLDEHGEPKILDFGLAKPSATIDFDKPNSGNTVSQELTKVGKILGTVTYMSPEQVRGEPVDSRSDIFAFGILLYRMVTGDLPFAGTTQVSTLAKILESVPEAPHVKNEKIPFELERIVEKCLQKNPADRYQDSRDLQVDLRNLRRQYEAGTTQTMSSRTAAMHMPGDKPAKEKRQLSWKHVILGIVIAPFAFVTIIALGGMLLAYFSKDHYSGPMLSINTHDDDAAPQTLAVLGFENKTNDTSLAWLETGLQEIFSTDLSQKCSVKVIATEQLQDRLARNDQEVSRANLQSAAKQMRADGLLSGTFYKLGDKIRIDARVQSLDASRIIMSQSVVGTDPFTLIDSITNKVAAALNLSFKPSDSSGGDALASLSPRAYRPYREGMDLYYSEKTDEAIAKLGEAVALDSTFALAHLRLGLALAQAGRQSEANRSLEAAKRHEGHLPVKEKLMVDAYLDIWLRKQFSDGKTKIASLVSTYPDDKELRTYNGIFLGIFDDDSSGAFAQFDTVLQIDPNYQFAIGQYAVLLERYDQYDRSVELLERQLKAHPDAPASYREIIRLYGRMERREDAYRVAKEYLAAFPSNLDAYSNLEAIQIRRREFAEAQETIAEARRQTKRDDINELTLIGDEVNIAIWQGNFSIAEKLLHQAVQVARRSGDTTQLAAAFNSLMQYYSQFQQTDSLFRNLDSFLVHSDQFQALARPMMIARYRQADSISGRKELRSITTDLRKRLPNAMWFQIDAVESMYDGMLHTDTATILSAFQKLLQARGGSDGQNVVSYIEYASRGGDKADAAKRGIEFLSGKRESSIGMLYIPMLLSVGIAEEGLGQTELARGRYEELLKYWGNADRPHPAIKETRERLNRLKS